MKLLAVFILAVLVVAVAAFPADPASDPVPGEGLPDVAAPVDGDVPPEGADLTNDEWRYGGHRRGYGGGYRRGGHYHHRPYYG